MQLPLKYRVWDGINKRMYYYSDKSGDGNNLSLTFYYGGIGWGLYDNSIGYRIVSGENKENILMYSIGENDKNGNIIYTKDLIETTHFNKPFARSKKFCKVIYEVYNVAGNVIQRYNEKGYECHSDLLATSKVIGNAIEHPHLIKL